MDTRMKCGLVNPAARATSARVVYENHRAIL